MVDVLTWEKLNIKVRILSTGQVGTVTAQQVDVFGNRFFIVKVGHKLIAFSLHEFEYLSSKKIN